MHYEWRDPRYGQTRCRMHGIVGHQDGIDDEMFQIRIHGRGGQGVVTGAGMLSVAAFLDGNYAHALALEAPKLANA